MKSFYLFIAFSLIAFLTYSQGLEGVVVETYYISDSNDATDNDGGTLPLEALHIGSISILLQIRKWKLYMAAQTTN